MSDAVARRAVLATGATSEQDAIRTIIARLPDGIVVVDHEGVIRFANPAAETLFQRSAEALVGSPFGLTALSGEAAEIEVVRPGGQIVTAELRTVAIDWDDAAAWLVSLRDVTDRKAAEERERLLAQERAARVEAEAANHARSELLAMMSHELRTPLNAVLGYADLLGIGVGGPLTDAQRQQVGRITASGRHLLALVNELLDLTRIETGRLTVRRVPVDLAAVVESAAVLLQPQAEAHGLSLVTTADRATPRVAMGDEHRIRQILVNLLSNAVKFTGSGGTLTVDIEEADHPAPEARVHVAGRWLAVLVRDTGKGMSPGQVEQLFTPFKQAEGGYTRPRDGSGLGLAISRRLARLMGGDITVRTAPAAGSTFSLWLPAARPGESAPPGIPLSGRAPAVHGMGEVGDAVLRSLEPLLDDWVDRLRAERLAASDRLRYSLLVDHTATFLAELASALDVLEEVDGQPSRILDDGADIRRLVAQRHGAQRARLGWSADALAREFALLRLELERTVQQCLPRDEGGAARARDVIAGLLHEAERVADEALRAALHRADDQ